MRISSLALCSTLALAGTATAGIQTNGIQTNGIQTNGIQTNGIQTNGIQVNGIQVNGIQTNGIQVNGIQTNGIQTNGIQVNGIQVNGTQLIGNSIGLGTASAPTTCSHREDVTGAALNNCSPCATIVGNADAYCRNSSWDTLCVSEAQTMCKVTIAAGTTMQANMSDGSSVNMILTARNQSGWRYDDQSSSWVDDSDVWWNTMNWSIPHAPNATGVAMPASTPNQCVKHVVAMDPYCGSTNWDSICVGEANSNCTAGLEAAQKTTSYGDSICGYDPANPTVALQAIFIAGLWDMRQGIQGAGGKKTKWPVDQFTIGCRKVGAVAKCVDFGYKPWTGSSMNQLHQACVRMVRDDLCGDGTSFTANGNAINVTDYLNIQHDTMNWELDATWTTGGATYIAWNGAREGGLTAFTNYKASHTYCQTQATDAYNPNWTAAHTVDGNPNLLKSERSIGCPYPPGPTSPCQP